MELFSRQDQDTRKALGAHINQRWGQLYELEKEWGEKAYKYLFFTNAGGAIATLSFLGAAPEAISMSGARWALLLFLVGVVLVGVGTATTYHHMAKLFERWKADVEAYYQDRIAWQHLQNEDEKRAVLDFWDYAIPYGSFACFVGGCTAGTFSLLTRVGT